MNTWMINALWLIVVITSSTAFFHFGKDMSTHSTSAICQENIISAAFSDARRALELIGEPTQSDQQAHLASLRVAVFRLSEAAGGARVWKCSESDRSTLAEAKRVLQNDPDKPDWMDARTAPAFALCGPA